MRIAIIGRGELMYDTAVMVHKHGYEIPLVITAKEAPEYLYTSKDFENFAQTVNARFIHTPQINTPEVMDAIKQCGDIDIALSINYSGVISENVIDMFRLGILNAHGGDLPRYRGNACQAWAIVNGESRIGLCIHRMIGGELDSGDIIKREYYELDINSRVGEAYQWMLEACPRMMLEACLSLEKDPDYYLEKQSKDPKLALRCYPRKPEDGKIDWNKSNIDILRLINASSEPFAGAFTFLDEKKMIVWRAELLNDNEVYLAVNGQVAEILKNGHVVVITGEGKLTLSEVEIDGERGAPGMFIKSIRKRVA